MSKPIFSPEVPQVGQKVLINITKRKQFETLILARFLTRENTFCISVCDVEKIIVLEYFPVEKAWSSHRVMISCEPVFDTIISIID